MSKIRGDIAKDSRLYGYLKGPFKRMARLTSASDLDVKRLGGSHQVYLIKDRHGHKSFILKSFQKAGIPPSVAGRRMNKEYGRLRKFDSLGIDQSWFKVVKPLGKSDSGQFFVERYVGGTPLGTYIREAFEKGEHQRLYENLTMFAGYIALLHRKTRRASHVRMSQVRKELYQHAKQGCAAGALGCKELEEVKLLVDHACTYRALRDVRRCLVHGDANPSNFLFEGGRMYVIDVERSGYRDPAYDLGTMAGELFHYALSYAGDPYEADPFIGHMFWMYAGNFSDQYGTFLRMTGRNPLYMANSLLRIARNPGLTDEHRMRLAYHAVECLKSLKGLNRQGYL